MMTETVASASELAEQAVARARAMVAASHAATTRSEWRRRRRLGRLLRDDAGRRFLLGLTDEVLRAATPAGTVGRLRRLGAPAVLGVADRTLVRAGGLAGRIAPALVARLVEARVRRETAGMVVDAGPGPLARHLARRSAAAVVANVNPLGEAVLSDAEADQRFDLLLATMRRPDVHYVSVKVSAIVAGIDVLAFDAEVARIVARLRVLYRHAAREAVFVNLDMEEYRDLAVTVAAFTTVLVEASLLNLDAGIVLQAYLPDAHREAAQLCAWANERRRAGGGRLKIRIVKGANLAMERVEAELAGWEQAPYASKVETDASFKRLLDEVLTAGDPDAVEVGVASHNVFDVAWALERRGRDPRPARIGLEMLEGMAPAEARVAQDQAGGIVLYTPVVQRRDFDAALAYLSRRLEENSAPENYLRALFDIVPGSPELDGQEQRFRQAVAAMATVSDQPRRAPSPRRGEPGRFHNEPDTDFTSPDARAAVRDALATPPVPPAWDVIDHIAAIDHAVSRARQAAQVAPSTHERRGWLAAVAEVVVAERFGTVALMAGVTAKTVREGDVEVSEAADFARYCAASTLTIDELARDGVHAEPLGVVVVAAPWNFPYAIPLGGVVGALAAGNAVILKPAPEAVAVGAHIVDQLHRAGVPVDRVQLVVCPDNEVGQHLVTHPGVDRVVLTGSVETAQRFLAWRPELSLTAETSGKNAIVVTASADLDDVIRDLVRSAFGNAGQKCSAASLAIVEADVLEHTRFVRRLADAVNSLRVGWPSELGTQMGPLIAPPEGKLQRALTTLDEGEEWLVAPRQLDDTGRLWSPGVRVGVRAGSWFHRTECFGPVLGIMRAENLDHAIELQNATDFGLTGGIHALDASEVERWLAGVEVGNAYVNRHITGAIVQRQPFGGWKASSVGGGAKAGGPDWVLGLTRPVARGVVPADSLPAWWRSWYGCEHDPSGLRAESNVLRYRPLRGVVVRHDGGGRLGSLEQAAALTGTPVVWSGPEEPEAALAARLGSLRVERLRLVGVAPGAELLRAAHAAGVAVDRTPVTGHGRVELGRWLAEQSVSITRHRHGHVAG
jgi:RHH-type proline utilization regulon transcriptional repressor/proline dehydrogenase/delta 1-pyrroline-5-carboxylate dehydrogenase